MKRMNHLSARGVTLVEVLIATAMSSVIIAGGVTAVIGFTNSERQLSQKRVTGQQLRRAMSAIERNLSTAGFGLDPSIAFDPHRPDMDCAAGVCSTDKAVVVAGYHTDDLLFASRDPDYFADPKSDPRNNVASDFLGTLWKITGVTSSTITVAPNANPAPTPLPMGTSVLAICPGGFTYFVATLSGPKPVSNSASTDLPLEPPDAGGTDPFRQQIGGAGAINPCFAAAGRLFVVNRYRYMLRKDPNDSTRRFLFLSRSLDRNNDTKINFLDWELVAANIEGMQVSHIMRDGSIRGEDPTGAIPARPVMPTSLGAASGLPVNPCSTELTIPFYRITALAPCSISDPQRQQPDLLGNTVRLRVNLVARSRKVLRKSGGKARVGGLRPQIEFGGENNLRTGGVDGFSRERLSVVVKIPNTSARGVPLI